MPPSVDLWQYMGRTVVPSKDVSAKLLDTEAKKNPKVLR